MDPEVYPPYREIDLGIGWWSDTLPTDENPKIFYHFFTTKKRKDAAVATGSSGPDRSG